MAIDIQARLYLSEIIGLDGAAERINKAFSRVDDPLSGMLKRGSQSLREYITSLEDLATKPGVAAKAQEAALNRLVKIQERLNRAQGADNRRENTQVFKEREQEQKQSAGKLRRYMEERERIISDGQKLSAQAFEQNNPFSTANLRRQQQDGKKFSDDLKTRLARESKVQADASKIEGRTRGAAINVLQRLNKVELSRQDVSKNRISDLRAQLATTKSVDVQNKLTGAISTEQNQLADSVLRASQYNRQINTLKSKSLSLTEAQVSALGGEVDKYQQILTLAQSVDAIESRRRKAENRDIGSTQKTATANQKLADAKAADDASVQDRLSLDVQKQRNKIVNEISSAQAKTRAEAEKLFEVDRKHNEAATEFNRRVGRTDVKPTTLGRDFAASTASFTNADPRHLADKLLNDPAFISEYNRNLSRLVGNATNTGFQSRQSVVAAGVAARDFTKGMVDNLAGRVGSPPGGGGGGVVGGGLGGGGNNPRRKAIDETNELKKAIDQSANSLNSFGAAAGLALRRFIAFRIGAQALYAIVGLFQQGASEAIKFEEELTKIQQTLDETDRGVLGLSDTIRGFARDVGTSAVEIAKGVRTFAQAGFDQVSQLEQVTSLISRIPLSTSFEGINETVEGSIAILGQFQAGLGDLGHIFDVTNQFAKDFAVESKDVFDAVKRAGSSFAIAGGSIEEFVALLSVLREGTRETGQILGTFFKTGLNQLFRPAAQKQLKQLGVDTTDTITNQLTQLGKTLFSKDSQFGSLQIIEIVRSLVGDSRQFPRLLALVRELSNDKTQDKIQNALQESSGSFIKDTEKRIDDFGISIKRAGQQIIDIFNEIIQNPAIKQLAKDFADLTENVTKLVRVAGPTLPSLFAGGAGLLFPSARREIGRAGQFIRGFGFGKSAGAGSVSGGGNRASFNGTASERLRQSEEGFVPISRGQGIALGAGVAITAASAVISRNTTNDDSRRIVSTVENAGLAFTSLVAFGINPLVAAAVGAAVGLNSLSDSIIKARQDVFDREFKHIRGPGNRIKALVGNDVNPFLGGEGEESIVTQIIKAPGRYLKMGFAAIERRISGQSNSAQIDDVVNSVNLLGKNSDVGDILFAREQEFLKRLKDPQDRFGQGVANEIKNQATDIFKEEKNSGKAADDINRTVRLRLNEFVSKTFTFLDPSAVSEVVNTVFQDFKIPKAALDDELIKPAKEFGDGVRLALSLMTDSFRGLSDSLKLAQNRFEQVGFLSSSKVNVASISTGEADNAFLKGIREQLNAIPDIFKRALTNNQFRTALSLASEGGVNEDTISIRQQLLENFSIGNKNADESTKKFLTEAFGPALITLSQLSGKDEGDIVKDLLGNSGGLFEFVDKLSQGLGEGGEVLKNYTEHLNEVINVINAQLDAQRRINDESIKLGDSIFEVTNKIHSLENAISDSNLEQSQLISGRSNPTAIAEGILKGLATIPNTQQLIGGADTARGNVNSAFIDALGTNIKDSDINTRRQSTERLLKAQNEYAVAQQKLGQQSTLLENNLSLVSKAAEIFKSELLALRGTVDSAGKTISGLEKKDLNSIIVSIGKFVKESNGFTNISQGLSKINPQEFDFLQRGLEIFNNFKLPGGLSGADVLGDINKTLGVPALGAILRAASGGKISQSDAEAQINQQIADALAKQSDAQQQEQSIRLQLIDLLQFQISDKQEQLNVLNQQTGFLSDISQNISNFGDISQTIQGIYDATSKLFGSTPQPVKIIETEANKLAPFVPSPFDEELNPRVGSQQLLGGNPDSFSIIPTQARGPFADKKMEDSFQKWYKVLAERNDLDKNPNAIEHQYDYRKAFLAGATPGADRHWPSEFKLANHPNRFVDGIDTITNLRINGNTSASPEFEGRPSRGNFPTFRELNDRHGRNSSPANRKSSNITDESIPLGAGLAAAGGVSFDQFVKMTDVLNQMNTHLMGVEDTLKQIASAPAIQMSLEVKPMQVNVNVSATDLLRLAGPVIAQQVIDKVAPAISEAFGVVSEEAQSRFDSGIKGTAAPEV